MLKALIVMVAAIGLTGGVAFGQTMRTPAAPPDRSFVLVKHDNEGDGPGRGKKLGHYKHRGDNTGGWTTTTTTTTTRSWVTPPSYTPYYGYGSSYPPAYDYYAPPPYYRGY